jgi:hypothetical protein
MHVHGPRLNQDYQINALAAAARTEARREAERTRRKLLSASSLLSDSENEDCIVTLGSQGDEEGQPQQQSRRDRQRESQSSGTEAEEPPFSDYA